ncbi:MAG: AAA family ATPase, partial [Dehalococcoidia bacterium]
MRPLRLEIEGFTAFRNKTSLNFEELDLFAITGPTGAGKSSLIDAISYALYGRIPRVTNQVASVISQGLDRMQVTLEFRANGRAFRVLRETRRKGSGNVRLELHDGEEWQPLADRVSDVNGKVEEIVGLDFDAFTRSALLPQGQFQQFLSGSPEERRNVLDKLLRIDVYRRMGTRASQEASTLNSRVQEIERRLRDELADATKATSDRLRAELKQAEAGAKTAAVTVEALQEGVMLARQLSDRRGELRRQREALDAATTNLEAAQTLMAGGDLKLKQLREQLDVARKELEANSFDDSLLEAFTAAATFAQAAERSTKLFNDAAARLPQLEKEAESAKKAAAGAAKAAAITKTAREAAQAALEEAGRHDLVAMLQSGLKVGDPCPVCGGVIGALADVSGTDVDEAQRELAKAKQAEEIASKQATTMETKAAVAESSLARDRESLASLEEHAKDDAARLEAALPGMEDRSYATIRLAVDEQRRQKQERDALVAAERSLASTLHQEEARLQGAQQQLMTATAQLETAGAAVAEAEQQAKAVATDLAEMAAKQGWTEAGAELEAGRNPGPGLTELHRAATARQHELMTAQGRLSQQIEQVEKNIELAKTLRDELAGKKAEHDVAADLALMLRADRFQAYVQREALRTLAEDGSRKLLNLSAGRYELSVAEAGQDFMVRDKWNADELRSVRTLSGGETFLASLALALSLAETLPGLAPGRRLALESIFLDEGFGSLDPEALDRAADALDALRMEDRLVCIVTHLKELAEKMPAQVVVTKS